MITINEIDLDKFLDLTRDSKMSGSIRSQLYNIIVNGSKFKDTVVSDINNITSKTKHNLEYNIDYRFGYYYSIILFVRSEFSDVGDLIDDYLGESKDIDSLRVLCSLFILALGIDYYDIDSGIIVDYFSYVYPSSAETSNLWNKIKRTYTIIDKVYSRA